MPVSKKTADTVIGLRREEVYKMDRKRQRGTTSIHDSRMRERNAIDKGVDKLLKRIDPHAVSLVNPDSFEAEQYRKLRHVLEDRHNGNEGAVVGVTSPVSGDGKSLTALNLAGALAQDPGARVLLIDVDIRRQSAGLRKALDNSIVKGAGLLELVTESNRELPSALRKLPMFNFSVIPIGEKSAPPYETLNSPRFGAILAEARRKFDFVILDAPPVIPVSDCRIIGKRIDGFIVVVAANHTPREMLGDTLNLVGKKNVIGLIFNRSKSKWTRYYGYGYYDGYGVPGQRHHQPTLRHPWKGKTVGFFQRFLPDVIAVRIGRS